MISDHQQEYNSAKIILKPVIDVRSDPVIRCPALSLGGRFPRTHARVTCPRSERFRIFDTLYFMQRDRVECTPESAVKCACVGNIRCPCLLSLS